MYAGAHTGVHSGGMRDFEKGKILQKREKGRLSIITILLK